MAMKPLATCGEVKERRRKVKEIIPRCHGNKVRAYDCMSASSECHRECVRVGDLVRVSEATDVHNV